MQRTVIKSVTNEHLIKYLEQGGECLVLGKFQKGNKTPKDGEGMKKGAGPPNQWRKRHDR